MSNTITCEEIEKLIRETDWVTEEDDDALLLDPNSPELLIAIHLEQCVSCTERFGGVGVPDDREVNEMIGDGDEVRGLFFRKHLATPFPGDND